jgi:hypothetical protein
MKTQPGEGRKGEGENSTYQKKRETQKMMSKRINRIW